MSEYQYYEFLAIDRPLTEKQIEAVRRFSTRAEITSTRFVNEYHFGSFRGNPLELLEKYYDVMVYYANWGTRRFMMRVPVDLVDVNRVRRYCAGNSATMRKAGTNVILDFTANEEDYSDWEEDGQWTSEIVPARAAVLAGDEWPLYLAWLTCVQAGELKDDAAEPPIPAGMRRLTGPAKSLAEFLMVDDDLLSAAVEASGTATRPLEADFATWISTLPVAEKDELLTTFCQNDDPHLGTKLRRRFQKATRMSATPSVSGRTAGQLLQRAEELREQREAVERRQAAEERERRQADAARERTTKLAALARRGDAPWNEVWALVASKQTKAYEQAIHLLKDLRDVAGKSGSLATFRSRVSALREAHAKKPNFIKQLKRSGLADESPNAIG
jgi:hypothetical protein